ncbi:MAG: SH3 domain-containing protein [Spirochaetia bacterium]
MTARYILFVIGLSALFLVSGCGRGPQGYGVVLWPPEDSPLEFGMLVEVTDSSDIADTYTIRPPEDGERITTEQWRIESFETNEAATEFAEDFDEYRERFASSARQALRVRTEQDTSADSVYRLRQGEEVKIISRSDDSSEEGQDTGTSQGVWYEVLTREGSRGWVPGRHLSGIEGSSGVGIADVVGITNPRLDTFLSTDWRPTYFQRMIESDRIDLERFREEYGLFPEPEQSRLRLNLPDESATFDYETWSSGQARQFIAEGTRFSVIVRSDEAISIRYTIDGERNNIAMERVDEDISEVRAEERERRAELYESLVSRGSRLASDAYGTVELREDNEIRWQNYDRLVPSVIPRSARSEGRLRFDHFRSDDLEGDYDGALSFHFDGAEDEPVVFLYQFVSGGLRLAHVREDNIEDKIVQRESRSPVVIFFSFQESAGGSEADDDAGSPEAEEGELE